MLTVLEKLSDVAETGDSCGLAYAVREICNDAALLYSARIALRLGTPPDIMSAFLRHGVRIGSSRTVALVLSRCAEFTIADFLRHLTLDRAYMVGELHVLGAIPELSIADIDSMSPTYQLYRYERFAQYRASGYAPCVAHVLNGLIY